MTVSRLLIALGCSGDDPKPPPTDDTETSSTADTGCTAHADDALCTDAGASCGEVQADDGCGQTVTVDCGTCAGDELCGLAVPNQCDDPAAVCTDGVLSGAETDVDCGGPDCAECPVGAACIDDEDCEEGICGGGTCVVGSWSTGVPPMPTARGDLAVVWAGGRLYAMGGFSEDLGAVDRVEVYDPGVGGWTTTASLPYTLYNHDAAVDDQGRIYVIGGSSDSPGASCRTAIRYDPSADAWSLLELVPTCRSDGRVVFGDDGLLYAVGGFSADTGTLSSVDVYDPGTNTWSTGDALATERRAHVLVRADDGSLFAVGGRSSTSSIGDPGEASMERLVPGAGWFTQPDAPFPRDDASAVFLDGRIVNAGFREVGSPGHKSHEVDVYDVAAEVWLPGARMPTPRRGADAAVGPDGAMYVVGGWLEDVTIAESTDVVEAFHP